MGTIFSCSLPDELIIKCIWLFILKITPILTKLKVLCNLHVTNKAWKTLINGSNYDWDNFIWVSLEMALDQQTLEESKEQSVGSDSSEDGFYDYDDSLRYDG
jgi:hypothetical protein